MRKIIKGHESKELLDFKVQNRNGDVSIDYNSLGEEQRTPLKNSLLSEQGFLCAYTLKRISCNTSHIEHIQPEELSRKLKKAGEETISDLDYSNMVACFPKEFSGSSRRKFYGAFKKDDWWENDGVEFISPLREDCENHFKYNKIGLILEVTAKGKKTIEVLNLNHEILKHERANAINEFIYKNNKPLTKLQTLHAVENICVESADGFVEFCVAIKHSLEDHLKFLEKIKQKRKFIARSKKKKS